MGDVEIRREKFPNEYLKDDFEKETCYDILQQFENDKKSGNTTIKWRTIPAEQYKSFLTRFMESPEMARIPYSVVNDWFLNIIVKNTLKIDSFCTLAGHSEYFTDDVARFYGDDELKDFTKAAEFLLENGFYDWARLPDMSYAWTDFAILPLFKLISEYKPTMESNDLLILINKIIDVVHCRGDITSAFVEGGSEKCSEISGKNRFDKFKHRLMLPVKMYNFKCNKTKIPKLR